MKVLGIDPGSLVTGYGIVESGRGGSLGYVACGTVRLGNGRPVPERLYGITRALNLVIEEFAPDAVAVESIFFAKNVKSAIMLGQARGAALVAAAVAGLEVFEYDPRTIKLAVTGYGAATKDQVQLMVRSLLNRAEPSRPDAADALAAAICHINSSGRNSEIGYERAAAGAARSGRGR